MYKLSGMLGMFKNKGNDIIVVNKIWIDKQQKWNACLQMLKENSAIIFVTWFDDTFTQLDHFLQSQNFYSKVIMYRQALQAQSNNYIFAEHYPLSEKEIELFEKLELKKITVLSHLNEPLFKHFGSEKIIQMLHQLGLNEEESLEHAMITSAIVNAQHSLSKQVLIDSLATSQEEWMRKNVK